MKQWINNAALCVLLLTVFLGGCGKQSPAGTEPTVPQPSTQNTQAATAPTMEWGEGELPLVTVPPQTEPVTVPTEQTNLPVQTDPTEETNPPETTAPMPQTTPTETTAPTEATQPNGLDEDELPPMPVG